MDKAKLMQLQGEYRIVLMQAGISQELSGKLAGKMIEKLMDKIDDNDS